MTNEESQHTTLREYLVTLRRRRGTIILIALSGVLVALAISLTQSKTYTASASFRVKSLAESLSLAGLLPAGSGELPGQTAAQGAETATAASVLNRVRKNLGLKESNDALKSRISATQEVQSNLINVAAHAPTAAQAATLANAVNDAAVDDATAKVRAQYAQLAADIRGKIGQLGSEGGTAADVVKRQQQQLGDKAANLEAISTIADPADVATLATPPSSPSSPKPVRNAILGGIVGLIIGLIAAGVLESLDRRLRRPDEIQAQLGLPLVGIVPSSAMGGVPIAGIPAEEHVAGMDAFRMLRTNVALLGEGDPPHTILVTSPLPEEGKTTVAVGLALAGAAAGERTLLVEADFHRPVHAERLGIEPSPGLADYLTTETKPGEILQAREFEDPAVAAQNGDSSQTSTLVCITAGTRERWSGKMLTSGTFAGFLQQVGKVYDLVVIDSGPLLAVADPLQIAPHVDAVVYCVRLGRTTREEAKIGKESLDRLPDRPTGLVTTGVTANESDGYSYYAYAYSYRFGEGSLLGRGRSKAGASRSDD